MLPNSFAGKWRFLWRYSSNIGENEGARKILYLWVFHAIFPGQDIPRDRRHVNTKSHLRASSDRPHQDIFRGWLQPKQEPKKWRILNISYVLCTEMALLFLQKILWIITLCLLFCNKGNSRHLHTGWFEWNEQLGYIYCRTVNILHATDW